MLLARGRYDSWPEDALAGGAAPAWTRPCQGVAFAGSGDCERVRGRVVLLERRDPDGDGDRHLVVVARLHVHVIKLPASIDVRALPAIGSRVEATGLTMIGASRRREIRAEFLRDLGRAPG